MLKTQEMVAKKASRSLNPVNPSAVTEKLSVSTVPHMGKSVDHDAGDKINDFCYEKQFLGGYDTVAF